MTNKQLADLLDTIIDKNIVFTEYNIDGEELVLESNLGTFRFSNQDAGVELEIYNTRLQTKYTDRSALLSVVNKSADKVLSAILNINQILDLDLPSKVSKSKLQVIKPRLQSNLLKLMVCIEDLHPLD